ncbi:MAG: recombinase family protein [Acidibrevibacterium sp.]|jgi:DNA invertase Pin-like site-specific DNA recombinase|uniref:recombinase family protein n=1 Tax=Acidibrevibacterium fodinaquatile TaxID=1969806 RepID=UPI0023A7AC22|nr:recombinase family protein [Acidibrevibacterium fodinaquatile]MCA7120845.1 recombinase family protein [Acidibrevibacterium fodinaquatile]
MSRPIRCAIYTRKSSEEGLEQSYNSLDAQRDACAAYILSQAGEGWALLPQTYDDGGFSGGTLERPALQRLLGEIEARRVDVVVVYKVDRLTRALADFARIVEILDQNGASFVSVTQAFNTTTSMGRLTLNVLLSFAQFEREVTGERIRDKIAASKKLGLWMGGIVPLGYRAAGRTLEIVEAEAATARHIFRRYEELGSVHRLRDELAEAGIVSKRRSDRAGRVIGGKPYDRGALYHLLRNPLYCGDIRHKGVSHPGQHPAIITRETFDAVQKRLDDARGSSARRRGSNPGGNDTGHLETAGVKAPLTGLIFDADGSRMTPVSARKKGGAVYRYYVSLPLLTGQRGATGACRINAVRLEQQIARCLARIGLIPADGDRTDWTVVRRHLRRVAIGGERLSLVLAPADALPEPDTLRARLGGNADIASSDEGITVRVALETARRSGGMAAFHPGGATPIERSERDPTLVSALIRAEAWKRRLLDGEAANLATIAIAEGVTAAYIARMVRLAFLAPHLKRQILEGRQPAALTLQHLMTRPIPLAWEQQTVFGRP